MHARSRCPAYTYYLLLRTSETRYYWITFLIRPLFPLRETEKAKARKASERVEDRKLPPPAPPATSFSATPPPPPPLPAPTRGCLCVCPGAFSLLLAHPPPPEQREPPLSLSLLEPAFSPLPAARRAGRPGQRGGPAAYPLLSYSGWNYYAGDFICYICARARQRAATNEHIFA